MLAYDGPSPWPPRWLAALVIAAACGGSEDPARTASDAGLTPPSVERRLIAATMVALPPPGISRWDLPNPRAAGAETLVRYCTACHALPTPLAHSATDWPAVVRRMLLRIDRIDSAFGVPVPSSGERYVLMEYLLEHALRVTATDLPPGPGRALFSRRCSRCHDLPDPRQHAPEDWLSVAVRMARRSEQMLQETIPQDDVDRIVFYLDGASRARP